MFSQWYMRACRGKTTNIYTHVHVHYMCMYIMYVHYMCVYIITWLCALHVYTCITWICVHVYVHYMCMCIT